MTYPDVTDTSPDPDQQARIDDLINEAEEYDRNERVKADLAIRVEALRLAVSHGGSDVNVAANAERFYDFLTAGQD